MAGKITVSTINDSSGVLATQNGMTGIAKAWLNYNGTTQTITASFNVSSVTYTATGNYTVNFTTAMSDANYATTIASREDTSGTIANGAFANLKRTAQTSSAVGVVFAQAAVTYNPVSVCIAVFGS